MKVTAKRLSIEEAREVDIVSYLSNLGHEPAKINGNDYWYLSPLRTEKTPSFKVNRKMNRWYDHGLGKGGNIIDFAVLYNNCTVGEFLQQLSGGHYGPQRPVKPLERMSDGDAESKIKIVQERAISSFSLLRYLHQRRVPIDLAERFCREVKYELGGKEYFGIGFKNDAGGYEIRNPFFKASSAPKDITTFTNGAGEVAAFEGFIDFLSFMAIHRNQPQQSIDFVILNSVSLFERARPFMEGHDSIHLYLDRDAAGQNCSRYALGLCNKYKDESCVYRHYKDVNDWLVHFGKGHKRSNGQHPR